MPAPIETLAQKLVEARGIDYARAFTSLKRYIEELSDIDFAQEVDRVTDPKLLRRLLACGLPMRRQTIVHLKLRELEK